MRRSRETQLHQTDRHDNVRGIFRIEFHAI